MCGVVLVLVLLEKVSSFCWTFDNAFCYMKCIDWIVRTLSLDTNHMFGNRRHPQAAFQEQSEVGVWCSRRGVVFCRFQLGSVNKSISIRRCQQKKQFNT